MKSCCLLILLEANIYVVDNYDNFKTFILYKNYFIITWMKSMLNSQHKLMLVKQKCTHAFVSVEPLHAFELKLMHGII